MSEAAAIRVERAREAKPNGWWGIALFVGTEATLFGTLVGSYFYLRFNTVRWPPPGVPEPKVLWPLVLAGVLVATSLPMQAAVSAARAARRLRAWWLVLLAFSIQTTVFVAYVYLYVTDLDRFSPRGSAYGSVYFTLGGADHVHIGLGLLFDLWLLARLATRLTKYRLTGLRVVAFYWHFVNAATVAVVLTQLSPAL